MEAEQLKRRTAQRYSLIWSLSDPHQTPAVCHYDRVRPLLPENHLRGRVLEAGCGDGADTRRICQSADCQVVAVDLSSAGVRQTKDRTASCSNVTVAQADLENLPFQNGIFDFIYSYGVLHHCPHPEAGFRELARVLKPGGMLAIYLYEDFQDRSRLERVLLRAVNSIRPWTVSLPPSLLYHLCQVAAPFIFLFLTVPARILSRIPWTRQWSRRIPYHHGTGPFSLTGDLYDRFSAPVEFRYNPVIIRRWFQEANLQQVGIAPLRGWVAYGTRP